MFKKILFLILLFLLFPQKTFAAPAISISDPQYQDEEISVNVSLTGLTSVSCPNDFCYLQGAFTLSTSNPRYFGFTKNHFGNWYEYIGSPGPEYIQSTFFAFPFQASWSGRISFKSNTADPDYEGPGDYNLKLWRYTGNSDNPAGEPSNFLTVNIISPTPTPSPTPAPSSTSTPSPTKTPTPKPSTPKSTTTPVGTSIAVLLTEDEEISESSVLSESSPSSELEVIKDPTSEPIETKVTSENNLQPFFIGAGIILLTGSGYLVFRSFRKNE